MVKKLCTLVWLLGCAGSSLAVNSFDSFVAKAKKKFSEAKEMALGQKEKSIVGKIISNEETYDNIDLYAYILKGHIVNKGIMVGNRTITVNKIVTIEHSKNKAPEQNTRYTIVSGSFCYSLVVDRKANTTHIDLPYIITDCGGLAKNRQFIGKLSKKKQNMLNEARNAFKHYLAVREKNYFKEAQKRFKPDIQIIYKSEK